MAEKNFNKSWNPLNYSQNLCVVPNNGSIGQTVANNDNTDHQLVDNLMADSFSSLDLQTREDNGVNQLVNDLMANNDNDFRLDYIRSLKSHSINSFITENINTNSNTAINGYDCGDFRINQINKYEDNGINAFNALSGSQTAFNTNLIQPMISFQRYPGIQSFPQLIRPSNQLTQPLNTRMSEPLNNPPTNPLANQLITSLSDSMAKVLTNPTSNSFPNQMTNQSNMSLTSGLSQSNPTVLQSIIDSSKPMPPFVGYNQNQTYQRMGSMSTMSAQPLDMSVPDVPQTGCRQLRSIRSRNANLNPKEPMNKLNYYFDKTYEQFKHLEKERKKIECELIHTFVGQKISSANNIPIQRLPQNASKVDRIIIDMSREHAKVLTIFSKMEQLKGRELNELIPDSIHKWYEIIRELQMKRKIEIQRNSITNASIGSSDEFITQICEIMRQLLSGIRSVRTYLWCALVLTLYDQN